jgi:DNA-binding response OmpR family regulator
MTPVCPLNILIAEDEPSVAFSISFALKADGHRVEIATDGERALARLTAEPNAFDLLVTDNNMPRMTGVELVRRVRETLFCGKILVLSAHLSNENRVAYSTLQVDGMVPKPFDVHKLRTMIGQIAADPGAIIPSEFHLSRTEASKLAPVGITGVRRA